MVCRNYDRRRIPSFCTMKRNRSNCAVEHNFSYYLHRWIHLLQALIPVSILKLILQEKFLFQLLHQRKLPRKLWLLTCIAFQFLMPLYVSSLCIIFIILSNATSIYYNPNWWRCRNSKHCKSDAWDNCRSCDCCRHASVFGQLLPYASFSYRLHGSWSSKKPNDQWLSPQLRL